MEITNITPDGDNFIATAILTDEENKQFQKVLKKVQNISMGYTVKPALVNYHKLWTGDKPTVKHPVVQTPLSNKESPLSMATVTSGIFKDQKVCILVEFSDGYCICDMGGGKPMQVINIKHMNL